MQAGFWHWILRNVNTHISYTVVLLLLLLLLLPLVLPVFRTQNPEPRRHISAFSVHSEFFKIHQHQQILKNVGFSA